MAALEEVTELLLLHDERTCILQLPDTYTMGHSYMVECTLRLWITLGHGRSRKYFLSNIILLRSNDKLFDLHFENHMNNNSYVDVLTLDFLNFHRNCHI